MARKPRQAAGPAPLPLPTVADVQAPSPIIDRYPVLIGGGITLQYISSALRVCTTGYRQLFVDLFNELTERDSHAQAMIGKRVQTIAGGRIDIAPPDLPPDDPEAPLARKMAAVIRQRLLSLPDLTQRLANLAWGDILGVAACEAIWAPFDGGYWPERLTFIHSRRLSYPDAASWDLHLWDQGTVTGFGWDAPTNRPGFGLNLTRDMPPGKFVVHTPQFRNDYPTREGLGRALLWLMAFKVLGMRQGSAFIERFTKILIWGTYATQKDGNPRPATDDEVRKARDTVTALGLGTLTSAMMADAIQIKMDGPGLKGSASSLTVADWIDICDSQTTKLLLGSTFTTEPGKFGSKGTGEVGKEGELEGARFSAGMLAQTLKRDLVLPCVDQNWPGKRHLAPTVAIHLDKPNPHAILELNTKAAASGIPVDADAVAAQAGIPILPRDAKDGRRMAPLKAVDLSTLDPTLAPPPPPPVPAGAIAPDQDAPVVDDADRPNAPAKDADDPDTAEGGVTNQAGGDAGDD